MENKRTKAELIKLWDKPLEMQYNTITTRIIEAIKETKGDILICFSGGKDSALLLDMYCEICSKFFSIKDVFVGYADTTNETHLMRKYVPWFIKRCEQKYGVTIHLTETKPDDNITFAKIVKEKGIPFISKNTASSIRKTKKSMLEVGVCYEDVVKYAKQDLASRDALREMGLNNTAVLSLTGWSCSRAEFGKAFMIARQWLPLLNCEIDLTEECCTILKKRPLTKLSYKNIMTGEQASESVGRENEWLKNGCNYYTPQGEYKSKPLGSVSSQTVLYALYIRRVPLSEDYGQITYCTNENCFECTKANRTGCSLCGFGIKFDCERFIRLQETEPSKIKWAFKPKSQGGSGYKELCEYSNEYCGTKIVIPQV